MNEKPSRVERLRGDESFDPEAILVGLVPEALARIESMDYVGAFSLFAERLETIEHRSPKLLLEEKVQRPARAVLKTLWKAFLADIKDDEKKVKRLHAMEGETERRLGEMEKKREESAGAPPVSEDRRKYMAALGKQNHSNIAVFPNRESEGADFRRQFDEVIRKTIEEPTEKAFEPELRHIDYIGSLFNTIMPVVRESTEGYVAPMIAGKRGIINYLPVTALTLNGNVIAFLKEASGMAQALARGYHSREDANRATHTQLLSQEHDTEK